jgi:phosphoglycolate phosphatase
VNDSRRPIGADAPVVLFDLDGTLVDTAPEIADAVNDLLQELRRPRVPDALVLEWIGEGTRMMLTRALKHAGIPDTEFEALWPRFEVYYGERCGRRSTPYPGIRGALERLRAAGATLAVVTNKEAGYTRQVLDQHALTPYFALIVAGDTLAVRKPDPAVIRHALQGLGAHAEAAVLVGDSIIDVRAARAAGIPVWAVRHGYHHGRLVGADLPDHFIDHFDQLGTEFVPSVRRRA